MAGIARLRVTPELLREPSIHVLSLIPADFKLVGAEATDKYGAVPFLFETAEVQDRCMVDYTCIFSRDATGSYSVEMEPALCG